MQLSSSSDPSAFDEGLTGDVAQQSRSARRHLHHQVRLHQSGVSLAARALAYGSLLACTGSAALFFAIWKLSGAKDLKEFR